MQYTNTYDSPLGKILLASDGESLTGLWFDQQKYYASTLEKDAEPRNLPVFTQTKKWLDAYFTGDLTQEKPPLNPDGTDFRKAVWGILLTIPAGETVTYGSIAKELSKQSGMYMSAQAVGGAVGHNPISVLIPCHRVVGSDGSLTGYAGGIARKIDLLEREHVDLSNFRIPRKGTAL